MDLIYRFDPFQPVVIKRPADSAGALRTLLEGNQRLVSFIRHMQEAAVDGTSQHRETVVPVDLLSLGVPFFPGAAVDQAPFALVLGCSDARVPVESIFDQSFNDLFVVRIAGNVLGTECLGSFDYAVRHLRHAVKAVIVLGHTGCGAVTAGVDTYLNPNDYAAIGFTHALRSLVDRLLAAVRGAAHSFERHCGHDVCRHASYRAALIEASVYLNAAITAFDLKRSIPLITQGEPPSVYYGVCDIDTMLVQPEPSDLEPEERQPSLRLAPSDTDEMLLVAEQLAAKIATRERMAS